MVRKPCDVGPGNVEEDGDIAHVSTLIGGTTHENCSLFIYLLNLTSII